MSKMNLPKYIEETYGVTGEKLFDKYPDFRVFRHGSSRKWFAVLMELPGEKLGLSGGNVRVVNVKCDPRMIGSFRQEKGIYPGYHMNKVHWITVLLGGNGGASGRTNRDWDLLQKAHICQEYS